MIAAPWAQWSVFMMTFVSLFGMLYQDVNGRPAKPPVGFGGVIGSLLSFALNVWVYYKAGALSTIF